MRPEDLGKVKRRVRLLQLLDAAERAGIAPIELSKLHAFAYLADILSPVWALKPFQARLAKTGRSPYFPDLQKELDALVAMGLVEVSGVEYRHKPGEVRVQLVAKFALHFALPQMEALLLAMEDDAEASRVREHLVSLADALAALPQAEIDEAATEDATYSDPVLGMQDYIDLQSAAAGSRTQVAVAALERLFPDARLPPGRRVVMYAHYLGQRVRARA